jgi:iduronate 2-sulfatase
MKTQGQACRRLTELVDLYPTLCELAGIPVPPELEGTSFLPLLSNPRRAWKQAAFCHYVQRPKVTLDNQCYIGYSMTTERYHYVQWHSWDQATERAGQQVAVELYDHRTDPQENVNVAGQPPYADDLKQLAQQLQAGWRAARPSP